MYFGVTDLWTLSFEVLNFTYENIEVTKFSYDSIKELLNLYIFEIKHEKHWSALVWRAEVIFTNFRYGNFQSQYLLSKFADQECQMFDWNLCAEFYACQKNSKRLFEDR